MTAVQMSGSPSRAATERPAKPEHFRPDIQGLRAIAVGAVVLFHGGIRQVPGGYVGVDVFFVISGFLISSHLIRSLRSQGRIRLAQFYARRALRILPASFAVIVTTVVAASWLVSPLQFGAVLKDAIATALYVPNYRFAAQGTDYLNSTSLPSLFQHYWSLGVEEQFYVVWPALLTIAFLVGRRSVKALAVAIAVTAVTSFAACVLLSGVNQPWAFFSLGTRAWEFALGGLVGLAVERGRVFLSSHVAAVVAWVGLVGLGIVLLTFDESLVFPGYVALLPVLATAMVILGNAWGSNAAPTRLLSLSPLTFIGTISYSIYLVHWPLQMFPASAAAAGVFNYSRAEQIALMVLSVPAGWVLYRVVETPFRTSARARSARPRNVLLIAAGVSVAIAAACALALLISSRHPIATSTAAAATSIVADPVGTPYVPVNLNPTLRDAADTVLIPGNCELLQEVVTDTGCAFGSNADAPVIVLFGDSHASQWFPALAPLAERGDVRIETYTKSSCPAPAVSVTWKGMPYDQCTKWRQLVIDKLARTHPALVLLGAYRDDHDATDEDSWRVGFATTIKDLSFTRVALLVDTPQPPASVPTCLASHLTDTAACDVTLEPRFRDLELEIGRTNGVPTIDLTPYLCRDDVCPAIVGNTLVYRDGSHITAAMSGLLSPFVARQIQSALAGAPTSG